MLNFILINNLSTFINKTEIRCIKSVWKAHWTYCWNGFKWASTKFVTSSLAVACLNESPSKAFNFYQARFDIGRKSAREWFVITTLPENRIFVFIRWLSCFYGTTCYLHIIDNRENVPCEQVFVVIFAINRTNHVGFTMYRITGFVDEFGWELEEITRFHSDVISKVNKLHLKLIFYERLSKFF